jgi:biotin carboxylase
MGLPSCGPYESVCILQNKRKFRRFLTEHGFNVPVAKGYKNIDEAEEDRELFHWPVIVKPTDSAGSKGVKKVEKPEDLRHAIEYAISFSRSNEFIIEDFITQYGFSSDSDSFSVDGELKFVSFNSQRFDIRADNPYTPAAYSWPASISQDHQIELTSELQRLIKLLRMKTSIYNIETREGTDGKAYIMECSPRGGGNRLAECLECATGVKLVENTVKAAMGMKVQGIEQKPYNGYWAEVVLHSKENGIFDRLWISDSIKECVVEEDLWISRGDPVHSFTAANYAIGTLILRFSNEEKLEEIMKDIASYVEVVLRE